MPEFSTPGSPSDSVVAEYEAKQAALVAETETCRWCKQAKRRRGERWDASTYSVHIDHEGVERKNGTTREGQVASAMCKAHAERSRLNFVCSPVSEAYWCS